MCTNNWHNSSLFLRVWASSTISTVKVCIPISLLVVCGLMVLHPPVFFFDTVGAHPGSRHRHHHYCYHVAGPWGRLKSSSPVSSTLQAWCHSHHWCHSPVSSRPRSGGGRSPLWGKMLTLGGRAIIMQRIFSSWLLCKLCNPFISNCQMPFLLWWDSHIRDHEIIEIINI